MNLLNQVLGSSLVELLDARCFCFPGHTFSGDSLRVHPGASRAERTAEIGRARRRNTVLLRSCAGRRRFDRRPFDARTDFGRMSFSILETYNLYEYMKRKLAPSNHLLRVTLREGPLAA